MMGARGELRPAANRSGSKKGPKVKKKSQPLAIALKEADKARRKDYHNQGGLLAEQLRSALEEEGQRREARRRQGW
jgi:hypothetical protein